MLRKEIFRSPGLLVLTIFSFMLIMLPVESLAQATAPAGSLVGFIYGSDMKTPVQNAVVKIRSLDNGQEYASDPTDNSGAYKIGQVKEGKYILGINTPNGDYNFDYVLVVKGGEMGKLSMALKSGEAKTLSAQGQERPAEKEKVSFFRTPAGIAVLMVATTLALYGVFKLLEGEEEASPTKK
ncbi:MAG TPA: hypothetical protein PLB50_03695 [Candidatus Saccharicenans sp.]|jgi:hypothetical protein|nr:hypothetical protein [Candidatus Saccharicenans sp.]HPB59194.1 hypothetical protein [Candidatus Saccharicenans sp.]HQO75764.1 hypothetical protein [Candidatus Saccharicenans sp.]HUM79464.1 hypothetical protein [Candidatus Saccharicenans sp.]